MDLARALGIRSVAEGMETPDAAAALAAMGCDAAQERPYCGALDPAATTAWLADHLRPAAAAGPKRGGAHPRTVRQPGEPAAFTGAARRCGRQPDAPRRPAGRPAG